MVRGNVEVEKDSSCVSIVEGEDREKMAEKPWITEKDQWREGSE